MNHSSHRIAGLTLHVTVENCPAPDACTTVGEADPSTVALDIAPGATGRFTMLVYLPDVPMPRAMKWAYEITDIRAGRE